MFASPSHSLFVRGWHFERRTTTSSRGLRLFLLDVPEHRDRRGDVAAHRLASRHRLYELAERHRHAGVEDALLDLFGELELLLGIAFARELHAQLLDLLVA